MKNKNKQDVTQEVTETKLVSRDAREIIAMFNEYKAAKLPTITLWKRIKSLYNGKFWEIFASKVKEFTLTPDTNYIEYVVTAFVNSIYSGIYIPEIVATDLKDEDMAQKMNAFIESEWMKKGIKRYFTEWGENVGLYNMQPVKTHLNKNKKIDFENINPGGIYLDPSVSDYKKGEAIFISKEANIYSLMKDQRFKAKIKALLDENPTRWWQASEINQDGLDYERYTVTGNKTVSITEYYIKTETGIDNGFFINDDEIIYEKKNIIPNCFPIEILYQRKPNGNPYGTPIIAKIINSYITLNLLDSMDATQPYLAQNRPKFFDLRSRINPKSFIDYGNSPGATFPLFGDPSKAIFYQDIQFIPDTTNIKNRLENGIFHITGVDMAYRGRQTNSIITTGGVEAQQARVIMLTDNGPLVALESFVEDLAKLYIKFNIEFTKTAKVRRNNFVKEQVDIVFKEIDPDDFNFTLESKPYLPMTKQTRFETLKQLYEMQGQYKFQIPLIQEEDLVNELPVSSVQKSKLIQRISSQKQADAALKRRETLLTFADLFKQLQDSGLSDDESANEAMKIMDQEEMMRQQDPTLGTNPQGMPPQGGMPGM